MCSIIFRVISQSGSDVMNLFRTPTMLKTVSTISVTLVPWVCKCWSTSTCSLSFSTFLCDSDYRWTLFIFIQQWRPWSDRTNHWDTRVDQGAEFNGGEWLAVMARRWPNCRVRTHFRIKISIQNHQVNDDILYYHYRYTKKYSENGYKLTFTTLKVTNKPHMHKLSKKNINIVLINELCVCIGCWSFSSRVQTSWVLWNVPTIHPLLPDVEKKICDFINFWIME